MLYFIVYDIDGDPTVHHNFETDIDGCNAVPWEEVQLELQDHYRVYGTPEDVVKWEQMTTDEYFKLP